ncbi:hypothetical protein [Yoonia sediminilitoris]|uniref:Uncharacterized protein n=1 Tax=Yoonia sediminilitoris TaxID=1286148 RepID=A0A2T6KIM5_9RHOB|nr:hypothetical protein [Yoonia sediminilitoris]PUB15511.1 hypothetical protein C8N45_104131 [Yoonia sediminilitoris]RCW96120.1 hypothetical protein DFP92_104130 [Yoonia sediminilitoris]
MDFDLLFVIGVTMAAFSIPAFMSAFSDRRGPKMALFMLIAGAGAAYYAMSQNPAAYSVATFDDVFVSVVAKYLN